MQSQPKQTPRRLAKGDSEKKDKQNNHLQHHASAVPHMANTVSCKADIATANQQAAHHEDRNGKSKIGWGSLAPIHRNISTHEIPQLVYHHQKVSRNVSWRHVL